MRTASHDTEVNWLERGLTQDEVEHGRVICLNNEEEDFLERNVKQFPTNNDMAWIAPYVRTDQVRIPRYGPGNGYGYEKDDFVQVKFREQRFVQRCEQDRRRYRVFDMPRKPLSADTLRVGLIRRGNSTIAQDIHQRIFESHCDANVAVA